MPATARRPAVTGRTRPGLVRPLRCLSESLSSGSSPVIAGSALVKQILAAIDNLRPRGIPTGGRTVRLEGWKRGAASPGPWRPPPGVPRAGPPGEPPRRYCSDGARRMNCAGTGRCGIPGSRSGACCSSSPPGGTGGAAAGLGPRRVRPRQVSRAEGRRPGTRQRLSWARTCARRRARVLPSRPAR
jgi:hypothetical protein